MSGQLLAGPPPKQADQVPAVDGRRRRLAAPVPPNRDPWPKVRHLPVSHLANDPKCPACRPAAYSVHTARHRADREA